MTRQKGRKWISVVIIIVVFVVLICAYIIPFILLFDNKNIANSLRDIISIYTCITTAITALITGINILLAVKQHREDRQIAIFTRWYNELILNRHLEKIRDFYNFCEVLISEFEKLNKERERITGSEYDKLVQERVVNPFTSKFTSMRKNLISDLSVIDRDISIRISNILQQLQDDFFKEVEKSHDHSKVQEIIVNSNRSIMKELIQFNKSIMENEKISAWIVK